MVKYGQNADYLYIMIVQLKYDALLLNEGLNGVVAFTVNGYYFGFFTANG